jgi:hypothetical protein
MRKLPTFKTTFLFVKRLAEHVTFGKIAAVSGKDTSVAEAWGRPYESDEFPAGTGKKDPSQTVLRLLGLAHRADPGLAHEWAAVFPGYVEFLDERDGAEGTGMPGCIFELMAKSGKEHMDVMMKMLKKENVDWSAVNTEYQQFVAVNNKFGACLKEELKGK